ncbi:MAG: ice-binding family protein, partial [Acidimicrobiales bacterium]
MFDKKLKSKRTVLLAVVAVSLMLPFTAFGLFISSGSTTPVVSLGTASPFAVLAYSGITNTGTTTITGNVGSYPTPSETGFGTVTITGTNYPAGAPSTTQTDLAGAITQAMGYSPTTILTALDGQTLVPGVYKAASTTFTLSGGVLTLNGNGNTSSVWIFQAPDAIAGALSTTGGSVVLTNGADSCHVFWVTSAGGATLGTGTTFVGTIMAYSSVTLAAGTTLNGAALANTGDVTMDSNTISNACVTAPVTSTSTTSTTTTSTTSTTTQTTTTHTIVPIIARVCSTVTPPPTPLVYLTVDTVTTSGAPLPGILILCNSQNGQLTSTASSPAVFPLDTGTNHSIGVDDSACYVFAYWSDTG